MTTKQKTGRSRLHLATSTLLAVLIGGIWLGPSVPAARAQSCSFPKVERVKAEIVSPQPEGVVHAPVPFHLRSADPPHCDVTFKVTVDGVLYRFLGTSDLSEGTAANPHPARRLSKQRAEFACISAKEFFGSIPLSPGAHRLRITGCSGGTAVPKTVPADVSFSVREPLPVTGSPQWPLWLGIALVACGLALVVWGSRNREEG